MLSKEEFIETQAAFQFGKCEAPSGLDLESVARREAIERPSLAMHNVWDGTFVPADRGVGVVRNGERWTLDMGDAEVALPKRLRAGRKADVLSDLYEFDLQAPVLLDMNDAARWPNEFPTFQYNRLGGASNAILWPLRRVHEIGSSDFISAPNPAEPAFAQKESRLFWRGSLRGFSRHGRIARSITGLLRNYVAGQLSSETIRSHLATVSRYIFVSRYFDTEGFDIGFSPQRNKDFLRDVPEIQRFEKERVTPSEQLACRYLVAISGTDVASSFGWQVSTNSVILRETYPWEVFFDGHFRPWEHYIPIKPDFSDVTEKIAWCESHLEECQRMIELRHELIPLLLDESIRREALRRVVARYSDFYRDGNFLPQPRG